MNTDYINNHKTAYSRFQLTAHSLSNSITPLNNITSLDYNNVDYITHFDTISSKNTGITQDWKFYEDYMMVFKDKKVKSIKKLNNKYKTKLSVTDVESFLVVKGFTENSNVIEFSKIILILFKASKISSFFDG